MDKLLVFCTNVASFDLDNLEELLRDSGRRLHKLFESLPIGIYRTTPGGRILMANATLMNMLGFASLAEFVAMNLEHDSHSSYPRSLFKHRLECDGEIRGLEATWPRRDGTMLAVCEHARAVRAADGRVLYYEGTVEDITERKQAEERLRASEQPLAEPQVRNFVAEVLREAGWQVDEVAGAERAFELVREQRSTLVFCDVMLSGSTDDGFTVLRRLTREQPKAHIVLMTASAV